MEIGISLGSNFGHRAAHLGRALDHITTTADATLLAQSSVYETEPIDVPPEYQDLWYYNAVIIIKTKHPAQDWLPWLKKMESDFGRDHFADRNTPRPIDADILYAGDQCIESGDLTVPHPRWAQRRFVIEPLAEIRPDLVLPGWQQSIAEVLAKNTETIYKLELCW